VLLIIRLIQVINKIFIRRQIHIILIRLKLYNKYMCYFLFFNKKIILILDLSCVEREQISQDANFFLSVKLDERFARTHTHIYNHNGKFILMKMYMMMSTLSALK